eukprot:g20125.t1
MGRCCTFASCRGRFREAVGACCGVARVDEGVPDETVPVESGQGRGGEYVSRGGISLEVVEMATDDLLDVDAVAMIGEYKANPIAVAGGKRRGKGGSTKDGSDPVDGPVNNGAGEYLIEEEGGYFGGSLVEKWKQRCWEGNRGVRDGPGECEGRVEIGSKINE